MSNSSSSCSALFVCTAILCWDYHHFKYSFFNITQCTPKSIHFKSTLHLIARNNRYSSRNEEKHSNNGFICSDCKRKNFIESNSPTSSRCHQQITRIQLKNYCPYRQTHSVCQCFLSNQSIEPITDWMKALVKPGKGLTNTNRVNHINRSSSLFVYILVGSIFFLVILGGMIAMIFYWIKIKSHQLRTVK